MKKGIAILLVAILVIDLASCTSYKQLSTQEEFKMYQDNNHILVLEIHSKKDSLISFNEKYPGKMANNQVYGLKQKLFSFNASDSIIFTSQDQNAVYIKNNGILYKVVSQDKSGFYCISPDTVRIPYSEATMMKIKKHDPAKSAILIAGSSAAFVIIVVLFIKTSVTLDIQGLHI